MHEMESAVHPQSDSVIPSYCKEDLEVSNKPSRSLKEKNVISKGHSSAFMV